MTIEVVIVGRDAAFFAERLGAQFPSLGCHAAGDAAEAVARGKNAEILLIRTDEIIPELIDAMPKLRLIQALTTGTDHIEALPNLPKHVLLAAARGFHGPQMTELVFVYMLHFVRDFRSLAAAQDAHRWDRRPQQVLAGKTVVTVGVGAIAEELAKRCKAFAMHVIGVSAARTAAPNFDAIVPRDRLYEAAALADFLVVLVPYSKATHHLIDHSVLAAMKPSGVLINIARGGVVDEAALIHALMTKRIGGAGLDVFETEPLPQASPLWNLPNVFITSHIGGRSAIYAEQVLPLVIENLRAFLDGRHERMRYIVQR